MQDGVSNCFYGSSTEMCFCFVFVIVSTFVSSFFTQTHQHYDTSEIHLHTLRSMVLNTLQSVISSPPSAVVCSPLSSIAPFTLLWVWFLTYVSKQEVGVVVRPAESRVPDIAAGVLYLGVPVVKSRSICCQTGDVLILFWHYLL